ncbi:uncharacterized protein LOC105699297 [Orussus abietinus]|uniref:uncharacterized protein LOC105699297 n=1 Tax=Orussus abietinus TaxID=222816 RepID=UPI000C715B11|nr:uncharacterized protein LOC105699297 [Orussus abietinus]
MLFKVDEDTRTSEGPGSTIWKKPRLKDQDELVDSLAAGLVKANEGKIFGQSMVQSAALLDTALYFQSKTSEWWWVAEEVFKSGLAVAEEVPDDGQTLATMRFLYGRLLTINMDCPERSLDYLSRARAASQGKNWNVSKILGVPQESLFRECCSLLYEALLRLVRRPQMNPEVAMKACKRALKMALDCKFITKLNNNVISSSHAAAGREEYIARAHFELGKAEVLAGDTEKALRDLSKFLAIAKRIPDPEGVCNGHMQLAFAYKVLDIIKWFEYLLNFTHIRLLAQKLKDHDNTMKHLEISRELAGGYQLPRKLAEAHYTIGEYLLNLRLPKLATPHLEQAFTLYNALGMMNDADKARGLAAVSKGQEVMDRFVEMVQGCADSEEERLAMCGWKNRRIPFWKDLVPEKTDEERGDSDDQLEFFEGAMSTSRWEAESEADMRN